MTQLQALLNESLIRTKHVENAAAISMDKREIVASASGFHVKEQCRVGRQQQDSVQTDWGLKEGLYFKQEHYRCVRADKHSIYLQNADGGLIAVKTNAFILTATYRAGMHPSVCVEAVEKLGKATTCTVLHTPGYSDPPSNYSKKHELLGGLPTFLLCLFES
ncbi:profilin-4 [Cyrtonyx montezumae]|uniref:profilin-4 n=1 Tax=Cyrtonyx montezumae TaxID=9017 RepID=UPI0032DA7F2E